MARQQQKNEVYIEVIDAGPALKVSAACAQTLEEVSFTAPKNTPQSQIEKLALQKLNYVIHKKRQA